MITWCSSCVLPDSRPNLRIEKDGRCNACHSHSTKPTIDWQARKAAFEDVVAHARSAGKGYDCVIPVSGGKDSTWQTVVCLEHGLRPLAVTWRPPGRTAIGQRNLDNLVGLGVDHVDYRINPRVEARFMVKAFEKFGSTAIPMHLGLFNIPLAIAVRFDIPLVVWGENSAFEYGDAADSQTGFTLDAQWMKTYGVTHGTTAADWVDEELDRQDLVGYFGPTDEQLRQANVRAVFLGYYFSWDPESTRATAARFGFESPRDGARTGYYSFADIDDDFISLHHWMKWYKFGFTRTFDNLSLEIRNGRLDRKEAIDIIRSRGDETPVDDIGAFCRFADLEENRFFETAERFRNPDVWERRSDGTWWIPNFLIEDWDWS